jgi:hypothetical protein
MKNLLKTTLLLAIGSALLLMGSCKKDKTIISAGPEKIKSTFSNFSNWRGSLAVPTQKFRLDATKGGLIRGDRGYEFTIRPGTLLDWNNNPVTGLVDVELTEVTNAFEMMATGAGTWAEDGILGSVGMFNLTITQGGNPVLVNPNQPIQAMVTANPDASMQGVRLFRGLERDSAFNDFIVRWRQENDTTRFNADSLREVYDSIQRSFVRKRCIRFDLSFLNWCNLDKFWNGPGEMVRVEIPNILENIDTRVYVYIERDNLKGLIPLYQDGQGTNKQLIFNSRGYTLPVGWKIRIIVATRDKDYNLFYETRLITITAGGVHELKDLKPISDLDLETFFKGL